jgi:hypothetical protein
MSIRSEALNWFTNKIGSIPDNIYASKFYLSVESWPKTEVWWFQIPLRSLENPRSHIHLLCQSKSGSQGFYYIKVPVKFILDNLANFDKVEEKVSIYLSANPNHLFVEERGEGRIPFGSFLQP